MAETAEWGVWHDPDTEQGVAAYANGGLELHTPDQVAAMDDETLYRVAKDCGVLLQEVYKGTYPLSTGDAEALVESVREGETHLFTLTRDDSLVAMAALVRAKNKAGGELQFSELGRACGAQADGQHVPLRPLLKYRVPWAQENQPDTDFLYSSTRAAATSYDGVPSGQGVQSVWWGGRRHSNSNPMITTHIGWDYRLGCIEPFNGFAIPTQPYHWGAAVADTPLFVPSYRDKAVLDTLIEEGTSGRVHPTTVVIPRSRPAEIGLHRVAAPSERMTGRYVVSNLVEADLELSEANAELAEGFSQKVVIEADVAASPENANAMTGLLREGWQLVGWQPSEQLYGARCPVFARLNATEIDKVLDARQHPQYFAGSGLPRTQTIVDDAYRMLYANAKTV